MTQAEQRAVSRINNNIGDHLTPSDLQGALRDMVGNPVPKAMGGYWNHSKEVIDAMRGVRKGIGVLENVNHPVAQGAAQAGKAILNFAEEYFKGAGI